MTPGVLRNMDPGKLLICGQWIPDNGLTKISPCEWRIIYAGINLKLWSHEFHTMNGDAFRFQCSFSEF